MDSIEEKIEDIEVELDTIKDFVTESSNTLEKKIEAADKKKDEVIRALEQRIEILEKRIEELVRDSVVVRGAASNLGDWLEEEAFIPREMCDLTPEWQERLRDYVVAPIDGEKLTKAQLAFYAYHIQSNRDELGYGSALVDGMIQEGVKERFWYPSWKPEEVSDFRSYLLEKVKSTRRREKRRRTAEDLERRADMKKKSF